MEKLDDQQLAYLAHAREWCTYVLDFFIQLKDPDPHRTFERWQESLISLCNEHKLDLVKKVERNVLWMTENLTRYERENLNTLLKQQFGKDLDANTEARRRTRLLYSGTILNDDDYLFLSGCLQGSLNDPQQQNEVQQMQQMLARYHGNEMKTVSEWIRIITQFLTAHVSQNNSFDADEWEARLAHQYKEDNLPALWVTLLAVIRHARRFLSNKIDDLNALLAAKFGDEIPAFARDLMWRFQRKKALTSPFTYKPVGGEQMVIYPHEAARLLHKSS